MKRGKILNRFFVSFFAICLVIVGLWGWSFWQAKETLKYYVTVFEKYGCQVEYDVFISGFPLHINLSVPNLVIKGDGKSILHLLEHLTGSSLLTEGLKKIVDENTHIILTASDIKTRAFFLKPLDHKSSAHVKLSIFQSNKELINFDLDEVHIDYQNLETTTVSPNNLTLKNVTLNLPGTVNLSMKIDEIDYKQSKSRWNLRYKLYRELNIKNIYLKTNPDLKEINIDNLRIDHSITSITPSWSDLQKTFIQEIILYKDLLKERCTIFSRTMPPISPLLEKLEENKVASQGSVSINFIGSALRIDHTAQVSDGQPQATITLDLTNPQKILDYLVKLGLLHEKYSLTLLTFIELGMKKNEETYQLNVNMKEGELYKDGVKFFEYPKNIWNQIPLLDPICEHIDGKPINVSADYLLKEYEHLESLGRPGSQFDLGLAYFKEGRFNDAFSWYQKAANQKNPYALYMIGFMYYSGQGRSRDENKARDYVIEAIKCHLDLKHMRPTMTSKEYLEFSKKISESVKKG